MKTILFTLTIILLGFCGFSQDYKNYSIAAIDSSIMVPRYLLGENTNTGNKDTIGIIITLKQALRINTNLDILQLYRGLHKECDSTVNFLVQVVDDYKKTNILAEQQIKISDSLLNTRSKQIDNLKNQIQISAERLLAKDSIITAKDDLIALDKKELKHRVKNKNRWIKGLSALSTFLFWMAIVHPGVK